MYHGTPSPLRAASVQTSLSTPKVRRSVGVEPCRAPNALKSSLKLFYQCCAGWPGPGSSPPLESLGEQQPLRESLVILSGQGPCEQKPPLANCRFHTLAPGFLEGFSVRHISVCAVNAVVPDDPQKELVVRRPELPIVSVTRGPRHAPVQKSLHGLRLQQPSLEP